MVSIVKQHSTALISITLPSLTAIIPKSEEQDMGRSEAPSLYRLSEMHIYSTYSFYHLRMSVLCHDIRLFYLYAFLLSTNPFIYLSIVLSSTSYHIWHHTT